MGETIRNKDNNGNTKCSIEQIELTKKLNQARYAYEVENREIMSNKEYDSLYDKLQKMEQESGVVLPNSPTHNVGYDVVSKLTKVRHETPMLSLDKSKDPKVIESRFKDRPVMVSYKLDGLTVVLTYNNGELVQAVTRGNGSIGEDVTHTVRHAEGVPAKIPYKDKLVIRGEALITYDVFESINARIPDTEAQYKNPRNLASGTVRSLDANVLKSRQLMVVAFEVITDLGPTRIGRLLEIEKMGFKIVPYLEADGTVGSISNAIAKATSTAKKSNTPVDGLVVALNDIAYGESLGTTSKFPRHSMAFKWEDGTAETTLRAIEWSQGRSGILTPVAIFDPVELEGTTVQRASLHNITIADELDLGIGDRIVVYKANMIIPQVYDNLTRSGFNSIPDVCPVCGQDRLHIRKDNNTEVLVCDNPDCSDRVISRLAHFVSRDAMNIVGLSSGILGSLVENYLVKTPADLYRLKYNDLINLEGMGDRKVEKLLDAIESSRQPELANYITALGIPNVGKGQAKTLAKHFGTWVEFYNDAINGIGFSNIAGIGDVIEDSIVKFFIEGSSTREMVDDLCGYIIPKDCVADITNTNSVLNGKTVVITGDVAYFKNRKELQAVIENYGGKATGSVSRSTDYLINNDIESTSNKNKKAKELGIPIITEEQFLNMIGYLNNSTDSSSDNSANNSPVDKTDVEYGKTITAYRDMFTCRDISEDKCVIEEFNAGVTSIEIPSHVRDKQVYLPDDCSNLIKLREGDSTEMKLESIDFSNIIDTSNVKSMRQMFENCINLKKIVWGNFDTSNVKDMKKCFSGCKSLETLDLSRIKTDNTEDIEGMFSHCKKIEHLDLSSFNTSKVKNMTGMFYECTGLKKLNLGEFSMRSCERMTKMFAGCSLLKTVRIGGEDIDIKEL